jgi:hypothetical protein
LRFAWPSHDWTQPQPRLPDLSFFGPVTRWIDIFNRGVDPFPVSVETSHSWLKTTRPPDPIEEAFRLDVYVDDWTVVPPGLHEASVTIRGTGRAVRVAVTVDNRHPEIPESFQGYVEAAGVIAIEAPDYQKAVGRSGITWKTLNDHGPMKGGVTPFPVTAPNQDPAGEAPYLEYPLYLYEPGEISVEWHLAHSQDFQSGEGLRFGAGLNGEEPQIERVGLEPMTPEWYGSVGNSARKVRTTHRVEKAGPQTLRFYMVTPGVVLQRVVVDAGGLQPSYLGPEASRRADGPRLAFP